MNLTRSNQIRFTTARGQTGTLLRPILGLDFIAGLDVDKLLWRVMPTANLIEIKFAAQQNSLTKPLIERDISILEHLSQLTAQWLIIERVSEPAVRAKLSGSKVGLFLLSNSSGDFAVPVSAITNVWLWKTQAVEIEPV